MTILRPLIGAQVEMERFRKIARALGNRTPLQVQSRVQKYFIKLQKAGLPVPGRTYNFMQYSSNRKVWFRTLFVGVIAVFFSPHERKSMILLILFETSIKRDQQRNKFYFLALFLNCSEET